MMIRSIFRIFIVSFILLECNKKELKEPFPDKTNPNLELFGYTLIDVGFDDPKDKSDKTNFLNEVQDFTYVADILVVEPTDNISTRITDMHQVGVPAHQESHRLDIGLGYMWHFDKGLKDKLSLLSVD